MLETQTLTAPQHEPRTEVNDSRERTLRELFPYDYDNLVKDGTLGLFYYDPESGYDALMHALGGNIVTSPQGGSIAVGFHHEPSADIIWPTVLLSDGTPQPATRVDRSHLKGAKADIRRQYKERPFEPFVARVVIGGLRKSAVQKNKTTGDVEIAPAKSGMFPSEYDAMCVVQAIRLAYEGIDMKNDVETTTHDGTPAIVNEGLAPLLDGKSQMRIRFVLDLTTRQIHAMFPIAGNGIMNLTPDDVDRLLLYPTELTKT